MEIIYFNRKEKKLIIKENNKKQRYFLQFEYEPENERIIMVFKRYFLNIIKPYELTSNEELFTKIFYKISYDAYITEKFRVFPYEEKNKKICLYEDKILHDFQYLIDMMESKKMMLKIIGE